MIYLDEKEPVAYLDFSPVRLHKPPVVVIFDGLAAEEPSAPWLFSLSAAALAFDFDAVAAKLFVEANLAECEKF